MNNYKIYILKFGCIQAANRFSQSEETRNMYVTRPLSSLLKSADLVAAATDCQNSGFLVIQDQESDTYSCFGSHKHRTLPKLPFPQDRELTVRYTTSSGDAESADVVSLHPIFLVPLLNFPLSSGRYYAIVPHGKHRGFD